MDNGESQGQPLLPSQKKDTKLATNTEFMVWVDIETTGLDFDLDVILEIGFAITDPIGNILTERSWVINDNLDFFWRSAVNTCKNGNSLVNEMHQKSGLWDDIKSKNSLSFMPVVYQASNWLFSQNDIPRGEPLCGGSVDFNRNFILKKSPELGNSFHYRVIDTSSIIQAMKKNAPSLHKEYDSYTSDFVKEHRVLSDIHASISDYKWLLENYLNHES